MKTSSWIKGAAIGAAFVVALSAGTAQVNDRIAKVGSASEHARHVEDGKPAGPSVVVDEEPGRPSWSSKSRGIDSAGEHVMSTYGVKESQSFKPAGTVDHDGEGQGGIAGCPPCNLGHCPADLTGSGSVGVPSLLALLSNWGPCGGGCAGCTGDLTCSANVGVPDLLALLSQWGPCPPPGDNNTCAGATTIFLGETSFNTTETTTDGPAAVAPCFFFGSGQIFNDVYFMHTATQDAVLIVSTCNQANFDTKIHVYTSCDMENSLVACNDDATGCGATSEVSLLVAQGESYIIRVGGYDAGDAGTGTLSLAYTDPAENNTCDNAMPVLIGDTFFSNLGATTDGPAAGEACEFFLSSQVFNDVYFEHVATQDGVLRVSTCNQADFDTKIHVYRNCNMGDADLLGCNDDAAGCGGFTSRLDVEVTQGSSYFIRVGAYSAIQFGSGTLTLSYVEPLECPKGATDENELCSFDDNGGCNSDPNFPLLGSISCGETICGDAWSDNQFRDTDWFEIVSSSATLYTFCVTAEFPAVIGLIESTGQGTCADTTGFVSPVEFAAPNEEACVTVPLGPGTWWWFVAPGSFPVSCDGGNTYVATLSCADLGCPSEGDCCEPHGGQSCEDADCCAQVCSLDSFCCTTNWDSICAGIANTFCPICNIVLNDTCNEATELTCGAYVTGSTAFATYNPAGTCGTTHTTREVWFEVVGTGGTMQAHTCDAASNYDTKLTVWTGGCDGLVCVGGNDDMTSAQCPMNGFLSRVSFQSVEGQTYYIMVHGFSQQSGNFGLHVICE